MALNIGLVPNSPDNGHREQEGTHRGDPRSTTGVARTGEREEEEERERVEEEEEGVKVGDFVADSVDLGFFEGDSA